MVGKIPIVTLLVIFIPFKFKRNLEFYYTAYRPLDNLNSFCFYTAGNVLCIITE